MKITRDVIYDLLPAYFAGDVSADTRTLIDEFLVTDPEFARMTARFRRLFDERGLDATDMAGERARLEQARSRAERRQIFAGFAVAYTLAALFPLAMDLLRGQGFQGKSLVISIVFAAVAFASTIGWLMSRRSAIQ
jgi:ferric-dicitrate binding protein FerR (iron transport regulator)